MSDIKFCPSCGTSLSASAVFCHSCGQKQSVAPNPEPEVSKDALEPDSEIKSETITDEQAVESVPTFEVKNEEPAEDPMPDALPQTPAPSFVQPEVKQPVTYTPDPAPVSKPAQPANQAVPPMTQAAPQPQPQPQYQPQQQTYQQMYYQPAPMPQQQAPAAPTPKKKFPWFFSILWFILFVGVGLWAFFLFFSEGYQKPVFTEDAQRFVIFAVSAAVLIYTLSLKLSMRKAKLLPTIILILAAFIGVYFFCMIELTDGDWLHDAVSEITNSILPVSGE